jgi:hypothetical protein
MIDRAELERVLQGAAPAELVSLGAEIQGRGLVALVAEKNAPPPAPPSRFITPDDAADIAGVPAKRIYDWARKQPWAHRPTKRCLRIDEAGFREWLASE